MRRILLFDGECSACSELGRAVVDLRADGLEARPGPTRGPSDCSQTPD